ncbi:hypothetical protein QN277_021756 [Acacia crassicarpa]|uniref:BHLH domain-containing protein n=1 Tax=Acacia crassicarpa TaxID=499986 RepID=A0AAE1JRW6_9FABA|nr:hypothetical protein QN277_021756 [Acacia crassicarpa]
MAEKPTESIRPGITASHLASTFGNDFNELVWQNGQILVQGGSSSRTMKRPSCFGYEAYHEDHYIAKRARLNTLHLLLDPSHQNPRQTNDLCSYPFDFSNKHGDEFSNLRAERESDSKPTGGSSQLCSSTSLQTHKHGLGSDERVEKINFSNFLKPALLFKSTYQGNSASRHPNRLEEIKATDGGSSKALDHSVVIDSAKGSRGLKYGVHPGQTAFTSNKANSTTPFDGKKDQDTLLPDEQSEAVGCDRALRNQGSHGQYHHQTHSRKGKTTVEFSRASLMASSSLCSLGASNDPSLPSRKHEDTDDSTYVSDNDEETEDTTPKETPAQDGSRGKRIRNTRTYNLSERKRRDKINKKMRALKQLIPNCNEVDKASMLDDAIDYLKTLKLQLQVLSMGSCVWMPPMMSMLGIGIPSSLPHHQFLPQMIPAGFPNPVLPNTQFPIMSQQSPFVSMPPKPIQPFLSSHLSTFDHHDSDLNAQLVSAAMPKVTQGSK